MEFRPDHPELWHLVNEFAGKLLRHERITALTILEMYDALVALKTKESP